MRARDVFIGAFLVLQLLLPLRYYAGGGGADERFAWRMFSSQRLASCTYAMTADGAPIPVSEVLGPSPYTMDLVPRGEPDVVVALMRFWCDRGGVSAVRYDNRCVAVDGERLPERSASLRCDTGRLESGRLP